MTDANIIRITTEFWLAAFCATAFLINVILSRKSERRKTANILLVCIVLAFFYMVSDIIAVWFRGDTSTLGWWMTRLGNGLYYLCGLGMGFFVGEYLGALVVENAESGKYQPVDPDNLKSYLILNRAFTCIFLVLMIITQFYPLFYGFDEMNRYYRGDYYWMHLVMTLVTLVNILIFTVQERRSMSRLQLIELLCYCLVPEISVMIQTLMYGTFVVNVAVIALVMLFMFVEVIEQRIFLADTKEELNQMKLQLLASQIQPHFMFNTLNSIQSLIIDSPDTAYDAVGYFADFIRGVLNTMTLDSTVPVEDELKTTKGYMEIEKLRFGDNLKVVTEIEDTDFSVPPLTIQPIIENAVRHGLRKEAMKGTVTLRVYADGDGHVIEIRDDGAGFDVRKAFNDGRQHVGIENVRSRIYRMCGGTMTIESKPGEGTAVKMFFPAGEGDEDGNEDTASGR